NPLSGTRADYIRQMIETEASGIAQSIAAKNELLTAGVDMARTAIPLESQYNTAYAQAIQPTFASSPGAATAADLATAAAQAGLARGQQGLTAGEVVTSVGHQTCADYYGALWDRSRLSPQSVSITPRRPPTFIPRT